MSTVSMLLYGLSMIGRPLTISRGDTTITATGYVKPVGAVRLAGSAQTEDATFIFGAEAIISSPLGELRKFDRISDGCRIYVIQDAREMKIGTAPAVIKGACSHA